MQVANLNEVESFTTLDGSTIREVAGPAWTAARNQSLAEATVPPGTATFEHLHRTSEEIYGRSRRSESRGAEGRGGENRGVQGRRERRVPTRHASDRGRRNPTVCSRRGS